MDGEGRPFYRYCGPRAVGCPFGKAWPDLSTDWHEGARRLMPNLRIAVLWRLLQCAEHRNLGVARYVSMRPESIDEWRKH